MKDINWYPGHMKKTKDLIQANIKLVDVVIELRDARIPMSSTNKDLAQLFAHKPRIVVLNKSDLADRTETEKWVRKLKSEGFEAVGLSCAGNTEAKGLFRILDNMRAEINKERRNQRPLRVMIVGIPNVGKSTLINRLTGKKSAQTGNRPGVTRGKQWLTLKDGTQLLDTPGVLWPKLGSKETGLHLAFCGSIKDEILDLPDLALEFIREMSENYPDLLIKRYKLEGVSEDPLETMEDIARKRGFIMAGKRIDYDRCALTVLDEFRAGTIGHITLEKAKPSRHDSLRTAEPEAASGAEEKEPESDD
ncbi:MAG: ribosome biogenesis GTPase YlqF [Eubacteriales bacterium]|nr:ribosome biogenesis GTPase YlqF [Eubacteriales bacterium]